MNITEFLKTPEANRLREMVDNFKNEAEHWTPEEWKSRCLRYALYSEAFDIFFDPNENALDIPGNLTAEDIWGCVEYWYHHSEFCGELFTTDGRYAAFEAAFDFSDYIAEDEDEE